MTDSKTDDMVVQMVRALAEIDKSLGIAEDGCNSTQRTLTAVRLLHAAHTDDIAEIARLEARIAELELRRVHVETETTRICVERDELAHALAAARAEAEALRKESARMDYVRKVFLLDDEEAMFDLFIAETVAEFNATIDGVLATRSPAVDAAIAKEKP